MYLNIEGLYACVETYIAGVSSAVVDPERADAHAIVVRFLAGAHAVERLGFVMDLAGSADVDLDTGVLLSPVPRRVKASLERLGYEVIVETTSPVRMLARKR